MLDWTTYFISDSGGKDLANFGLTIASFPGTCTSLSCRGGPSLVDCPRSTPGYHLAVKGALQQEWKLHVAIFARDRAPWSSFPPPPVNKNEDTSTLFTRGGTYSPEWCSAVVGVSRPRLVVPAFARIDAVGVGGEFGTR